MNHSDDRRVRKTKKLLRQGLIRLMAEKSVKDITVKELTEQLDINRGTFYLHYHDIYDLLEKIEDEIYEEFLNTINKYTLKDTAHTPEAIGAPLPLFREIFRFLAENYDVCIFLLGDNGDSAFLEKLLIAGKNKSLKEWEAVYSMDQQTLDYCYSFVASGCIGIIHHWLENGMKEPSEMMAALAEQMILTGLKSLEQAGC